MLSQYDHSVMMHIRFHDEDISCGDLFFYHESMDLLTQSHDLVTNGLIFMKLMLLKRS